MATRDFRSQQLRVTQIIASGSDTTSKPSLLIYSSSMATNDQGVVNASLLSGAGEDAWLFISGSTEASDGHQVLFGGNLAVSGTLSGSAFGSLPDQSISIISDDDIIFRIDSDGGSTSEYIFKAGDTEIATLNESGDLQIDGDATVSGGKITLTNGATIDSESAGYLILTEDVVKTSAALRVGGNIIQGGSGGSAITFDGTNAHTTVINNLIVNEAGADRDFRVETDGNISGIHTIGSQDSVAFLRNSASDIAQNDVNFYVAGTPGAHNAMVLAPGTPVRGVALFTGDVVVSGTLYAEKQVMEVDLSQTGNLIMTGAIHFDNAAAGYGSNLTVPVYDGAIWASTGSLYAKLADGAGATTEVKIGQKYLAGNGLVDYTLHTNTTFSLEVSNLTSSLSQHGTERDHYLALGTERYQEQKYILFNSAGNAATYINPLNSPVPGTDSDVLAYHGPGIIRAYQNNTVTLQDEDGITLRWDDSGQIAAVAASTAQYVELYFQMKASGWNDANDYLKLYWLNTSATTASDSTPWGASQIQELNNIMYYWQPEGSREDVGGHGEWKQFVPQSDAGYNIGLSWGNCGGNLINQLRWYKVVLWAGTEAVTNFSGVFIKFESDDGSETAQISNPIIIYPDVAGKTETKKITLNQFISGSAGRGLLNDGTPAFKTDDSIVGHLTGSVFSGQVGITGSHGYSLTTVNKVGIGVSDPDTMLEVFDTGTQLKLSFSTSAYATLDVDTNGNLTIDAPKDNANIVFKVDDGSATVTALTLDGGEYGSAKFTPLANGYLEVDDANTDGKTKILGDGGIDLYRYDNNAAKSGMISFYKSRGNSGAQTVVSDGDELGELKFYGYDTALNGLAATILAKADGAWGSSSTDSPGKLEFWTSPDGTSTPVERMTIRQDGKIGMGVSDPDSALEVLNTSAQLKLSYDGSNSAAFTVNSSGDLTITPSGGDATITGDLIVGGGKITLTNGSTIDSESAGFLLLTEDVVKASAALSVTTTSTLTGDVTIGGGYGSTGATISSAGVGQFNGALTTDGIITADSAVIGGGYGSTGVTISSAGVVQANGAITTGGALTADSAVIGGGFGSTGVTVSNAGNISADGNIIVGGNIAGDADEAKTIFAESTSAGSTITLGGGGLVVTAADLKVTGEGIQAADGNERISLADALVLKDASGDAVITLGATDFSTTLAGTLKVPGQIRHAGDENTFIDFSTDQIILNAGGSELFKAVVSGGTGNVVVNEGGLSSDFRVESDTRPYAFLVDGSRDQVSILSGSLSALSNTSNDEAAGNDVAFYVSGSVGSQGTMVRGTSVFGGDVYVSGSLVDSSGTISKLSIAESGTGWNPIATNTNTIAIGKNAVASGNYSIAMGSSDTNQTDATGLHSVALGGDDATASGAYASVLGGFANTAIGDYSVAMGRSNTISADGDDSMAFGKSLSVTTANTIAIGNSAVDARVELHGNAYAAEYLYHLGDENTYLRFTDDTIRMFAGGVEFLQLQEAGADLFLINNGGIDMDFRVESSNLSSIIHSIGSQDAVSFLKNSAADIAQNDVNFYVEGTQGTVGTMTRGTALFSGDLYVSGSVAGPSSISFDSSDNTVRIYKDGNTLKFDDGENSVKTLSELQSLPASTDFFIGTHGATPATAKLKATGSIAFSGYDDNFVDGLGPKGVGLDAFMFVSGSVGAREGWNTAGANQFKTDGRAVTLFGGDTVFSGSTSHLANSDFVNVGSSNNVVASGSLIAAGNLIKSSGAHNSIKLAAGTPNVLFSAASRVAATTPQSMVHIEKDDNLQASGANIDLNTLNLLLRNHSTQTNAFAGIGFDVAETLNSNAAGAAILAMRDTQASTNADDHEANLTFWTNDTDENGLVQRMTITHDGKVGIGVAAPAYALDVNGDINLASGGSFRIDGTTTAISGAEFEVLDDATPGAAVANKAVVLDGSGNFTGIAGLGMDNLVVDTNTLVVNADSYADKVGIGTATPAEELHLEKTNSNVTLQFTRVDSSFGDGNTIGDIKFGGSTNSGGTYDYDSVRISANAEGAWDTTDTDSGGQLRFYTTPDGSDSNSQKMVIEGTGHVGIGVGDPDTTLEIMNTSTQLKLSYDSNSFATMGTDSSGNLTISAPNTNADIKFIVDDNGTDVTAFTVDGGTFGSAKFTPLDGGYLEIDDAGTDGRVRIQGYGDIQLYRYSGNTESARVLFYKSRGNSGAQTVVSDGDRLGELKFYGYDTGLNGLAATMVAKADGTWAGDSTDSPGKLEFWTSPDGTSTPVERMTIRQDGKIGIGVADPDTILEVFSTSTQQKWSYDSDSFATITVAAGSATTIATAETADLTLDCGGGIELNADGGTITFKDGGASLGTITSAGWTGNVVGNVTGNADTVTNGVYTSNNLSVLAATTSAQLAGVISDETGSGALVFATSPTLVTPALGTPSALVGTSISGTASNLTAGKVTVNDSTANTDFPVAFHDESSGLLDDTGAFIYNPNSGLMTVGQIKTKSRWSQSIRVSSAHSSTDKYWILIAQADVAIDASSTIVNQFLVNFAGVETAAAHAADKTFLISAKYTLAADESPWYASAGTQVIVDMINTSDISDSTSSTDWDPSSDILITVGSDKIPKLWIRDVESYAHCYVQLIGGSDYSDVGNYVSEGWRISDLNSQPFASSPTLSTSTIYGQWAEKIYKTVTVTGGDITFGNAQVAQIDVTDTAAGTAGKSLTISAGSAPAASGNTAGGDLILKAGAGDGTGTSAMTFYTKASGVDAATERMRIHTDGNVGIGTAAPGAQLDIRGPVGTGAAAAGVLRLSTAETSVVNDDQLGRIEFIAPLEGSSGDSVLVGAAIYAEADNTFNASLNETELVFATAASATATEKMRLTSDGKLGIGTPTPQNIVHVNSATGASIYMSRDDGSITSGSPLGRFNFAGTENGGTEWNIAAVIRAEAAENWDQSANNTGGRLVFCTTANETSNSPSEHMRIANDGKVGIGTTSPATTLDVNGTVTATTLTASRLLDCYVVDCSWAAWFTEDSNHNNYFVTPNYSGEYTAWDFNSTRLMGASGYIKEIRMTCENNPGTTTLTLKKSTSAVTGEAMVGSAVSQTFTGVDQVKTYTFGTGFAFALGDFIGIWMDPSNAPGNVSFVVTLMVKSDGT